MAGATHRKRERATAYVSISEADRDMERSVGGHEVRRIVSCSARTRGAWATSNSASHKSSSSMTLSCCARSTSRLLEPVPPDGRSRGSLAKTAPGPPPTAAI
eukprot:4112680-Prymnesium_polylepis.1